MQSEAAMPTRNRIVSLIASATEIVCALGLRDWLVGRSHECDFPPDVVALPALTAPKFKVEGTSAEIDARVHAIVREGLSVYRVDGEALKALEPDVIVTQDHCEVCAVSLSDVEAATCTWTGRPVEIVSLRPTPSPTSTPTSAASRGASTPSRPARRWSATCRAHRCVRARASPAVARPRVAFIEWVEPLMAGGNWMPELIEAAGGHNLFGAAGSIPTGCNGTSWSPPTPEAIIVGPCGYGLSAARGAADAGGPVPAGRASPPCGTAASISPTATPTSTGRDLVWPRRPRCLPKCFTRRRWPVRIAARPGRN